MYKNVISKEKILIKIIFSTAISLSEIPLSFYPVKKQQLEHRMWMPMLGCGVLKCLKGDKKAKSKKGHNSEKRNAF